MKRTIVYGFTLPVVVLYPLSDAMTDEIPILRASIVDRDGRMTESEYAKSKGEPLAEIQRQFGATGVLKCGRYQASAQLTGDRKTLTTSAHLFKDPDHECEAKAQVGNCVFEYSVYGQKRIAKLENRIEMGYKCPKPLLSQDWAILKLRAEIHDVVPYDFPEEFDDPVPATKLISISGGSEDFKRRNPKTGKIVSPKSLEDCEAKYLIPGPKGFGSVRFESDCDSAPGNSGGSVVRVIGDRRVLVGITSGMYRHGPSKTHQYVRDSWATSHVTVSGEFLTRLKASTGR